MNPWNAVFVPAGENLRELIEAGVYGLTSIADRLLKTNYQQNNCWFRFSAENPRELCGYASCNDYTPEDLPETYDPKDPACNWPATPYTYEAYVELLGGGQQEFLNNDLREVLGNG